MHDCLVFLEVPGAGEWRFCAAINRAGIVCASVGQVTPDIEAGWLTRLLAEYELPAGPVRILIPPALLAAP